MSNTAQRLHTTARVSGLCLVVFLVIHLAGNLTLLGGIRVFDAYANSLRHLLAPPLPPSGLLWGMRIALVFVFLGHVISTIALRVHTRRYGPHQNQDVGGPAKHGWSMVLSGALIAAFLAFHIAHMSALITVMPRQHPRPIMTFSHLPLLGVYAAAMAVLCFHLGKGMTSLWTQSNSNAPNHPGITRLFAWTVAIALSAGLLVAPLLVYGQHCNRNGHSLISCWPI